MGGLLAGTLYDPGTAVTKSGTSLLAMTAIDTTNLRLTFTVPANGRVLVSQRALLCNGGTVVTGSVLQGILQSSTVISRVGSLVGAQAAGQRPFGVATYVVPGLTPGQSLTWDAAYGIEIVQGAGGLAYGGPNDTTTNNAYGGYAFEIWDTPNCLGAILYDPSSAASKVLTSLLAMTAFDTTNARITFTAPASGKVQWRVSVGYTGSTTDAQVLLGVLESSTVVARASCMNQTQNSTATSLQMCEATGIISGLTPGSSHTYDAAYGVEIVGAAGSALKYGGPNNTTTNDAWGALQFQLFAV